MEEIKKEQKKKPLGLLILGGLNFIVLGVLSLGFFSIVYINPSSETAKVLLIEFSKNIPDQALSIEQFKAVILSQIILAGIFLASGWGIFNKKEWGRRLTLYFSFFMVILAAVSVIFQPGTINSALLQVIYPGILIIYFTNKNIEKVFVPSQEKVETEEKE
ncbi:MAG: hypothetical protein KAS05_01050 [Candidatus Omnitrophica bacterium]|nr:hypothetical protein [Candidatus Omnitrophota bacterium]